MRRIYQKSWHEIPFDSFYRVSSKILADSQFYESFYSIFFQKYSNMNDLNPDWLKLKVESAKYLDANVFPSKNCQILSVGCGLGVMEMMLLENGYKHLEVTEVSPSSLKWFRNKLPGDQIHIGAFPDCLPPEKRYESILLSGVEYFLDDKQLVDFLCNVRQLLVPEGHCTMLSWSFDLGHPLQLIRQNLRDKIKALLEKCGIQNRGQLWGYSRTLKEYRQSFMKAGFIDLIDDIIDTKLPWDTYRITGRVVAESG